MKPSSKVILCASTKKMERHPFYHYQLEKGAVILDPDVREYFPDAKAVNAALRSLIALIPSKPTHSRRKTKAAPVEQR